MPVTKIVVPNCAAEASSSAAMVSNASSSEKLGKHVARPFQDLLVLFPDLDYLCWVMSQREIRSNLADIGIN